MSAPISPLEQMVVVLARDLADGELGAAGAAALVPMAAIALARELHAPNLTIGGEMFFNPEPGRLYPSMLDDRALGRCEAAETFIELFGHSHHGLDFFFHSGLQHDAFGNINLHHVGGELHTPGMRGPGRPTCPIAIPPRGSTSAPRFIRREILSRKWISSPYRGTFRGPRRNAPPA